MAELFFFGTNIDFRSIDSMARDSRRFYVINREYTLEEGLEISDEIAAPLENGIKSYYAIPTPKEESELFFSEAFEGRCRYIMDRVGAAALSIIFYNLHERAVNVASINLQARIYSNPNGELVKTPHSFRKLYKDLTEDLKRQSEKIRNSTEPKTVYLLPDALRRASEDSWPLPWESTTFGKNEK